MSAIRATFRLPRRVDKKRSPGGGTRSTIRLRPDAAGYARLPGGYLELGSEEALKACLAADFEVALGLARGRLSFDLNSNEILMWNRRDGEGDEVYL